MTSSKPAATDVVLFRSTPPRLRPIMIILTALALGLLFLGLTLTIVGNWPGFSPYGGNPLKIVGPILLALGLLVLIGISVDCCVRASKDDPGYYQKSFDTITHDRSTDNTYNQPKDQKLPPPEVHSGGIPPQATVIPLPTPPSDHRSKPYGSGKYNVPPYSANQSHESATMSQPGYTGGAAPLAREYNREPGRRGWGSGRSKTGSARKPEEGKPASKPKMHLEVNQKSGAPVRSGTTTPMYAQVKPRTPTANQVNGAPPSAAIVPPPPPPAQGDTTLDTSTDSAGPRKFQWGAAAVKTNGSEPGENGAPPLLQMKPMNAESKAAAGGELRHEQTTAQGAPGSHGERQPSQGHEHSQSQARHPSNRREPHKSEGREAGRGDPRRRDAGQSNPAFQGDNLNDSSPRDEDPHSKDSSWGRHARNREPRSSETSPKSHRRSSSGRRKGSSRHRSRSRDNKDRGNRSRDSSLGRSRETGGRRSASVEDLTGIDYTSGKPINRDDRNPSRQDEERRRRSTKDRSRDRDHRRDPSGERRYHRAHHNPAFEPDGHHHRSRGSPDHSRDSDYSERRRHPRDHSRDHVEPYHRQQTAESKRPKPQDTTASEKSTSMDDLLSMSTKNTTVVNPKFTININAQAGAAVHIGLGSNTANSPRQPPMLKAGPTGITQFPAVQDSPGPRPL